MQFEGRQTQFYIDLLYGIGFAAGFGYLLIDLDPRVVAFQGGLVFGYFLRVWEKMTVYERILHEEVAAEAEEVVAEEAEEAVASEVTETVEKKVPQEMTDQIEEEMDERIHEELDERVAEEVEERMEESPPPRRGRRER
jgi:cobalamin biosynthesis protein CbiD